MAVRSYNTILAAVDSSGVRYKPPAKTPRLNASIPRSTTARHCNFFTFLQQVTMADFQGCRRFYRVVHYFQGCDQISKKCARTPTTTIDHGATEGPTGRLFPRVKAPAKRSPLEPATLSKANTNNTIPWLHQQPPQHWYPGYLYPTTIIFFSITNPRRSIR